MASEFTMPKLGLTMESGTILEWLVPDGSEVSPGQAVLMIETDKVETEVESSEKGVLSHQAAVGDTFDCGELIGWYLAPGERAPARAAAATPSAAAPAAAGADASSAGAQPTSAAGATRSAGGRIFASPNAKRVAANLNVDLSTVAGSGPGGRIVSEDVEEAAANPRPVAAAVAVAGGAAGLALATPRGAGGGVLANFAARNLAELLGVDLGDVPSVTGESRLTREDVAAHVRGRLAAARSGTGPSAAGAMPSTAAAPLLQAPTNVIPMRAMRGTIAKRMHESLHQAAQLSLFMDVDMGAVHADREARKESGAAPGYTDYIIAATAKALAEHPYANSQITPDGVAHLPEVHIGMAVALDEGLMVPVIRNTASLDLANLSAETTRLAEATRSGGLGVDDLSGGTFSVTALGMFGVDGFTPIINPPNTAILGVGRLRDEAAWTDDGLARKRVLTLSLTWDHRAFDGAPAAEFTNAVKTHLESGELA